MTASDLQAALIPLAEKAGAETKQFPVERPRGTPAMKWGYRDTNSKWRYFPTDTLSDAEVTVVLGWLAKAGYKWGNPDYEGHPHTMRIEWFDEDRLTGHRKYRWIVGHGPTLPAALAAAVIALHEASQ